MRKSVFLIVLIATLCLACSCTYSTKATTKYRDVDGGVAIYRYSGVSTVDTLIIEDEHEGQPIVAVQEFAVANAAYLREITIGRNVRDISPRGFIACPLLQRFIVDPDNDYFETDEYGVLYNKGKTVLISYPAKCIDSGEYTVPDSVTKIGDCAFYCCADIKKINFGSSVVEIGSGAFIKCENLTNFVLPDTLQVIRDDAFSYCNSLTSVDIPASVTEIGDYAFYSQMTAIESITIHNSESNIRFGNSWQPTKNGMNSGRIMPVFTED